MSLLFLAVVAASAQGGPPTWSTPKPRPTPRVGDSSLWIPRFGEASEKFKIQDFAGAVSPLTECLKIGDVLGCYYARAVAYAALKKYELAMADVNKALEFWTEDARLYALRAQLWQINKDWLSAALDLNDAIRLDGKNPSHYLQRAIVRCNLPGGGVFNEKSLAKKDEARAVELGGKVVSPCQ